MRTQEPFYNKNEAMTLTMGHLPHLSQDQKLYAVTFRLHDSLPKSVIQSYMNESMSRYKESESAYRSKRESFLRQKMMEYMDMGMANACLKDRMLGK